MNAFCLPTCVRVLRADNDAGVIWHLSVQLNEIPTIQSYHGSLVLRCELQDLNIWNPLPCIASFRNREHIVTE